MNRAIAIGELHGAAEGLAALDALDAEPLDGYQPYHAARADLLAERAASTTRSPPTTGRSS